MGRRVEVQEPIPDELCQDECYHRAFHRRPRVDVGRMHVDIGPRLIIGRKGLYRKFARLLSFRYSLVSMGARRINMKILIPCELSDGWRDSPWSSQRSNPFDQIPSSGIFIAFFNTSIFTLNRLCPENHPLTLLVFRTSLTWLWYGELSGALRMLVGWREYYGGRRKLWSSACSYCYLVIPGSPSWKGRWCLIWWSSWNSHRWPNHSEISPSGMGELHRPTVPLDMLVMQSMQQTIDVRGVMPLWECTHQYHSSHWARSGSRWWDLDVREWDDDQVLHRHSAIHLAEEAMLTAEIVIKVQACKTLGTINSFPGLN